MYTIILCTSGPVMFKVNYCVSLTVMYIEQKGYHQTSPSLETVLIMLMQVKPATDHLIYVLFQLVCLLLQFVYYYSHVWRWGWSGTVSVQLLSVLCSTSSIRTMRH